MKKRRMLGTLLLAVFLLVPSLAHGQVPIKLWVHGDYVSSDVYPIIENSRTLVPLRVIGENLGYEVQWNGTERMVVVSNQDRRVKLAINSKRVSVFDGSAEKIVTIDVAAKIVNNRTFVPLRAVAELFGEKVDWDGNARTAIVGEGYKPGTSIEAINNQMIADIKGVLQKNFEGAVRVTYDPEHVQFVLHPIGEVASFYRDIRYYPNLPNGFVKEWNEDVRGIAELSDVLYKEFGIPFYVSINNPDHPELMLIGAVAGEVDYNFLSNPVINEE